LLLLGCTGETPAAPDAMVADTSIPDAGPADAWEPPLGVGDPCRGTPIPPAQHVVAPGLCAREIAVIPGARQLAFAPNGDLFVVDIGGTIHRLHDADGDGVYAASEISIWALTGGLGNDAHFDGAWLYAGSPTGVKRFPYSTIDGAGGGPGEDVVLGEPSTGHPHHTVHVWDGWLYVHSGSAGNATNDSNPGAAVYDTQRSLLRRFDLSKFISGKPLQWLDGEIVSQGLRNMVGYARTASGRMFGVVNGIDGVTYGAMYVQAENPGEQVVELTAGKKYGYPFCWTVQRIPAFAPGAQIANRDYPIAGVDDAWCAKNSDPPLTFLPAHSAPLDIVFFEKQARGALPERWRGGAFITLHGPRGRKIVWQPFDADLHTPVPKDIDGSTSFPFEIVLSGPQDGDWTWTNGTASESPRFVGLAIGPIDGALYATSDQAGGIYRVGIQK
jgi:glucose/arabinose dehydrogenase